MRLQLLLKYLHECALNIQEEAIMAALNANVDLCGIRNLLLCLEQNGFSRQELNKVLARIAAQTGADIILPT